MSMINMQEIRELPPLEQFKRFYVNHPNGGLCYQMAYEPDAPKVIARHAHAGYRILKRPEVRDDIRAIREETFREAAVTPARLLEMWTALATADPGELVQTKVGACRHCYGSDHGYQWREHEYMTALGDYDWESSQGRVGRPPDIGGGFGYNHALQPAQDCPQCQGDGIPRVTITDTRDLSPGARMLYNGAKQGKNGIEINMIDRTKALEVLGRLLGIDKSGIQTNPGSGTVIMNTINQYVQNNVQSPAEAAKIYEQLVKGTSVLTIPS